MALDLDYYYPTGFPVLERTHVGKTWPGYKCHTFTLV